MPKTVRIGNAQAFWGDRNDAAAEMLAREPNLDYLTLDYLAEVSMSILALQRQRDPQKGYAQDFVDVIRSLAGYWSSGGRCRLIANAGGLNPLGCATACQRALEDQGCRPLKIAIVSGDDILPVLRASTTNGSAEDFRNLDTGEHLQEIADRLVTANVYLGAEAMVRALAGGADIVITGRVADPSMVVAACRHHFEWSGEAWNQLAGATVAGHLIECGTQVTGGITTDWLAIPGAAHLGFPIVEVAEDGSCIVTKSSGTGGCVNEWTVKEQLLYEIGDPQAYLSPDVTVSFTSLKVEQVSENRVSVTGAVGDKPPEKYKVSATFQDGYRAAGMLTIVGRESVAKAKLCGEMVLQRVREAGHTLRHSRIECLGHGDCIAGIATIVRETAQPAATAFGETVLRIAVETETPEAAECFSRALMPLITAGPQGVTGYAEGRPRVHRLYRYWPCLVTREAVTPEFAFLQTQPLASITVPLQWPPKLVVRVGTSSVAKQSSTRCGEHRSLFDIAYARSGDKGIHANVGVIARDPRDWDFLRKWLTANRVAEYFSPRGVAQVERFELANLLAVNFVLHGILRQSLQNDAQGKTLGQIMLAMPLPDDAGV